MDLKEISKKILEVIQLKNDLQPELKEIESKKLENGEKISEYNNRFASLSQEEKEEAEYKIENRDRERLLEENEKLEGKIEELNGQVGIRIGEIKKEVQKQINEKQEDLEKKENTYRKNALEKKEKLTLVLEENKKNLESLGALTPELRNQFMTSISEIENEISMIDQGIITIQENSLEELKEIRELKDLEDKLTYDNIDMMKDEIESKYGPLKEEAVVEESLEYPDMDEEWEKHVEDPYIEEETENEEYPEYPDMDEEWEKHVADPYTPEEINEQIDQAYAEKKAQEDRKKYMDDVLTKHEIKQYMNRPEEEIVVDNGKPEVKTIFKAPNPTEKKQTKEDKVEEKGTGKGKEDKKQINVKVSAKDNIVYVNEKPTDLSIRKLIANRKEVFKKVEDLYKDEDEYLTINDMIMDELETVNPISVALLKRKLDPVVIEAIMSSNTDYKEASIRNYIYAMKKKELTSLSNFKLSYDLTDSRLDKDIDKKMQKYGSFANDVLGIKVEGLKEKGPKALFKSFIDRMKTLRLSAGKGERESVKEEPIPEVLETKFAEQDVKNNFVPLADEHTKAKLEEIAKRFAEEQEKVIPNVSNKNKDVKVTAHSGKKENPHIIESDGDVMEKD